MTVAAPASGRLELLLSLWIQAFSLLLTSEDFISFITGSASIFKEMVSRFYPAFGHSLLRGYIVWAAVLLVVKLLYYSVYIPDCLKFIIIITSKL